MPEYMFIDYKLFGEILDGLVALLRRLKKQSGVYEFTHIYAPPRGGLVLAVHLSHHLNIPMITMDLDYFLEDKTEVNILVIDDVSDTGKTFQEIQDTFIKYGDDSPLITYKFAAMHYKPRTTFKPEIFMQEVPDDTWIVYPWEDIKQIENDSLEYAQRRLLDVRDKAIKTGVPIVTATQQGSDPASEEDKQIWSSFLNVEDK